MDSPSTCLTGSTPTVEDILSRVRALRPRIRERGHRCDENSAVPAESVRELIEAGVFRMLQPRDAGGYEMEPADFCGVIQEVGRACASTGWITFVLGVHNFEVPLMGPQAVRDVWAEDRDVLISSSYVPFGKATRVDGGYTLSGRWHYSSGADHGRWAFLGSFVDGPDGKPEHRFFLVPRTHYVVDDTSWNVMGLRGTGSKDIVVTECFVPDYRTHSVRELVSGEIRGLQTYTNPVYRYPHTIVFGSTLASAMIGMSFGMIEEFIESAKVRVDVLSGKQSSLDPHLCRRLGYAETMVRSCAGLLKRNFAEMKGYIDRGLQVPLADRVRYKSDNAFTGRQCVDVITDLFRHSGARGTLKGNPLERFMRDVQVGANHISMNMDLYCEDTGVFLLTGEIRNSRL